jgi:hypothetical protein
MATAARTGKSIKRNDTHAAPAIAATHSKPAAIAAAEPITRRRILLASICGVALLAAAATFAPRGPASQSVQASLPKPAPAIAVQRTSSDAWANIRSQDTTGSITTTPRPTKKIRKVRKRPAPAKEENAAVRWFKQNYSDDKKNERRAATTR